LEDFTKGIRKNPNKKIKKVAQWVRLERLYLFCQKCLKKRKKLRNVPMRISKKERKSKALFVALIFVVVVILLILFSLLIKLGLLISRSRFDSTHQFIMQVRQSVFKSDVVIFAPDAHAITILALTGQDAGKTALQTIQVPVDALSQDGIDETDPAFVRKLLFNSMFHGKSTVTLLDEIRLFLFYQSSPSMSVKYIHLPEAEGSIDSVISSIGVDQTLFKEGDTIAIVNGTGISGFGNTVAKVLSHIGANVISVTTAPKDESTSSILSGSKKSYTLSRIEKIFGIDSLQSSRPEIADITIVIGADKGNMFSN